MMPHSAAHLRLPAWLPGKDDVTAAAQEGSVAGGGVVALLLLSGKSACANQSC